MGEDWIATFDAVFFISLGTLVLGFAATALKFCLKSKCEEFQLCFGLINIRRRVDLETEEEIRELELNGAQPPQHQEV